MLRSLALIVSLVVASVAAAQEYKLVHKLKPSETIRTKVTHLATTPR
jgi:hypothetical protein